MNRDLIFVNLVGQNKHTLYSCWFFSSPLPITISHFSQHLFKMIRLVYRILFFFFLAHWCKIRPDRIRGIVSFLYNEHDETTTCGPSVRIGLTIGTSLYVHTCEVIVRIDDRIVTSR